MMMMIRTKDLAAQEILLERWEAIESGKLKGRRRLVFVPPPADHHDETEVMRSLSFCYSQLDASKGEHHHCARHSSSSSPSWPNCVDNDQEVVKSVVEAVEEDRRFVIARSGGALGRRRYSAVFLGGFTVALLVVIIFILLLSVVSSGGYAHHYEPVLLPT